MKRKVRASKEWADLRKIIYDRQNGKDYFTGKPLVRSWNCHHRYFGKEHDPEYGNLDPDRFIGLNQGTHMLLHELAKYKDSSFVYKILEELDFVKTTT